MWLWRCRLIKCGKETWKRGDKWRGGGREYEGVDEGEMEGLHSLLHTVGFFFYFPFQVLSVLVTKPTDLTRERERERERESAHTHSLSLRTHAQMTCAPAAAAMHKGHRPHTETHRRRSRAACDRMRQLPVSHQTHAASVPSPPPPS